MGVNLSSYNSAASAADINDLRLVLGYEVAEITDLEDIEKVVDADFILPAEYLSLESLKARLLPVYLIPSQAYFVQSRRLLPFQVTSLSR